MPATTIRGAARRFIDSPVVPRIVGVLVRHRQLAWSMTARELTESHAGTAMGAAWTFFHPVLMISVYLFLYAVVFKARTGLGDGSGSYVAYLLSGLLPWLVCQEALTRSAMSIRGSASLVKKVLFPVELLPFKSVLASFCTGAILFTVFVCYRIFTGGLTASTALLPLLAALLFLGLYGVGLFLSVFAAYFRDLSDIVRVFTTLNVYLIPVVYFPDWVPPRMQPLLWVNPFSHVVWCFQDALYFDEFRHPWSWNIFPALSIGAFFVGNLVFRKLKPFLGSVL